MNRNEDLIDTSPTVVTDKTNIEFGSLDLGINERGEIVLSPDNPMRNPTIYMSCQGSEIIIEAIVHGRTALARRGPWPVETFKMGHRLDVTVTKEEPIKIVITNLGPERSNVGASLVSTPPDEGKYSLQGEGDKE